MVDKKDGYFHRYFWGDLITQQQQRQGGKGQV